jgi:hypothetical protein
MNRATALAKNEVRGPPDLAPRRCEASLEEVGEQVTACSGPPSTNLL